MMSRMVWTVLVGAVLVAALGGCASQTAGPAQSSTTMVVKPTGDPLVLQPGEVRVFRALSLLGTEVGTEANPVVWSVTGDIGTMTASASSAEFHALEQLDAGTYEDGVVTATHGGVAESVNVRIYLGDSDVTGLEILWPSGVDLDNVLPGQEIQFGAEGTDDFGNRSVSTRMEVDATWSCDSAIGTIDGNGLFTARSGPSSVRVAGAVHASAPGKWGPVSDSVDAQVVFPAELAVGPDVLSLSEATPSGTVQIQNLGSETLSWTASESIPWLTVTPTSGTDQGQAQASVPSWTGLTEGLHAGMIRVASNGGSSDVAVIATVPLQFVTGENGKTFTLEDLSGAVTQWQVVSTPAWLTVSPTAISDGGAGMATVDRAGLQEGTYSGVVTVSSSPDAYGEVQLPVELVVSPGDINVIVN